MTLLRYRGPLGDIVLWAVPLCCAPALLHLVEQLLARRGYVRIES